MKRFFYQSLFLLALMSVFGCRWMPITPTVSSPGPTPTQSSPAATRAYTPQPTENITGLPAWADLMDGWNQIDPGGNTNCARGGKYSFFVRKANTDKLLIYFEGGGSCYDAKTCHVGGGFFDDSIDPQAQNDNPAYKSSGVFDLSNERNPFRNYNIVFVSYCTGDAFMGNKVVTYTYENNPFQIYYRGYENTRMVLRWTYQNFPKPDSVFAIGCSAGVVGSFFNSPYILENYKDIPFTLIGDSGGGYLDGPASFVESIGTSELLPGWLPQYKDLISGGLVHSKLFFTLPAQAYPEAHFGLLDTQDDSLQAEILTRFNSKLTLAQVIQSNLVNIRADVPDFYSYTGPGDYHCITNAPNYYEYEAGGVKLNDWFATLASGQPADNITP
jgi:hypothetical protein